MRLVDVSDIEDVAWVNPDMVVAVYTEHGNLEDDRTSRDLWAKVTMSLLGGGKYTNELTWTFRQSEDLNANPRDTADQWAAELVRRLKAEGGPDGH